MLNTREKYMAIPSLLVTRSRIQALLASSNSYSYVQAMPKLVEL
jgi:hypothetical protein